MKNKKMILIVLLVIILIALILLLIDKNTYKSYSRSYMYMDTYTSIKINSTKGKKDIDRIFDDIDYLYSSYHKLTDSYNGYDDLVNVYYLNEVLKDGVSIVLDRRLLDIIKIGIDYYDKTDGLFNIASGNLIRVWKEFISDCTKIPNSNELDVNINISDIRIDDDMFTKYNGVKLDLGAIAKGYVVELISDYLEDSGISSYVINAGGNVKVGKAYDKESFVIGITDPSSISDIFVKLNINNLAVVTSGSYQRYCVLDDINYNHIINPISKKPSNYFKSVSVVSRDSTLSDIYSTYLFLLPVDVGLEVVNSTDGIEAIWYIDNDNIVRSDGFNYE